MQKIISLYQRNYDGDRLVRDEVVPGAEWVLEGEGIPMKKFNGTCCMIKEGKLYKRYDAKNGKTPPEGFIAAQEPDEKTGHWPGWLLVKEDDPQDKYHMEGLANFLYWYPKDGTYELIGPKINGNFEQRTEHHLIPHDKYYINGESGRDFESIKNFLKDANSDGKYMEGIVWHHPDGRMVKIKYKDFFKK